MTQPDIFLSYNREDQAVASRYAGAFAAEGLNVWWDTALRSGEAYDEVTEAALRGAKAVVVLWSPRSVVSRWVRAEATIADRNRTLVPCTIEPCERPIMFELTQTAELSHWTGDAGDRAWLAFLSDVRRIVGREVSAPAPAPTTTIAAREHTLTKSGKRGEAPSLAVLPFTNRSGLPEDEVFAIGMVEDVIDALSQGTHCQVLASSTTARFRIGAAPDVEAMGQQLGVRYLLEGNVRRVGSDLRVTAQLIEATSGAILWTQKFDRPLAELAALQEELVSEVAVKLGSEVFRLEMARALKKPSDLTAWECCTRALSAYRNYNSETIRITIAEATEASAIAPDYALGHALLALGLALENQDFGIDKSDARARWHADRAMALDPENANVLAWVCAALTYCRQPQEGLRHGMRAVQLSPGFSYAHLNCGVACVILNRLNEALAYFASFRALEPGSHVEYLAFAWEALSYARSDDWLIAEELIDWSLELAPDVGFLWYEKAIYADQQGRSDTPLAAARKARQLEPAVSLELWEKRYNRWFANSPNLNRILTSLRALWAKTEGKA